MRAEATLFFIDTKPSLSLLSQVLLNFGGKFLYGPTHLTAKVPANFPEINGCRPVVNMRGVFAVWQKLPSQYKTIIPSTVVVPLAQNQEKTYASVVCHSIWKDTSVSFPRTDVSLNESISEMRKSMENLQVTSSENVESQTLTNVTCSNLSNNTLDNQTSISNVLSPQIILKSSNTLSEKQSTLLNTDVSLSLTVPAVKKSDELIIDRETNSTGLYECHLPKDNVSSNPNSSDLNLLVGKSFVKENAISVDQESEKSYLQCAATSTPLYAKLTKNCTEINMMEVSKSVTQEDRQTPVDTQAVLTSAKKDCVSKVDMKKENNLKLIDSYKTSFDTKVIQTNAYVDDAVKSDTISVKALTDKIRNLVTSFENIMPDQDGANNMQESACANSTSCKNEMKIKCNCDSCKMAVTSSGNEHSNKNQSNASSRLKCDNSDSLPTGCLQKQSREQLFCNHAGGSAGKLSTCDKMEANSQFYSCTTPGIRTCRNLCSLETSHTDIQNNQMRHHTPPANIHTPTCFESKCNQPSSSAYIHTRINPSMCSSNGHNFKFYHNSCCNNILQRKYIYSCCVSQNGYCHQFCGCLLHHHAPQCNPQQLSPCHESRCEEKTVNSAMPNLVIPLQNIDQKLLAQLILILNTKTGD